MEVENAFMKVLCFFAVAGVVLYFAVVIHDTPSRCWLSYAPFTCAKTIELEQIIKENQNGINNNHSDNLCNDNLFS